MNRKLLIPFLCVLMASAALFMRCSDEPDDKRLSQDGPGRGPRILLVQQTHQNTLMAGAAYY